MNRNVNTICYIIRRCRNEKNVTSNSDFRTIKKIVGDGRRNNEKCESQERSSSLTRMNKIVTFKVCR